MMDTFYVFKVIIFVSLLVADVDALMPLLFYNCSLKRVLLYNIFGRYLKLAVSLFTDF
jgi:hypothetical protein